MNSDEIIKKAFDLGNSIAQSGEIEALKQAQLKLGEDKDAYDLVMRYQDARTKFENKKGDGLITSTQEENHLAILEQQLSGNVVVQELIKAQEKFDNLMQAVYFALNQAVSGGGSCSSGCDSCGGSCGM